MTYTSSQHHSFDLLLAARFGVEEAILIHHFQHWIRLNRYSERNIRDGKCWTYQTRKEIKKQFPYWNVDRVKYLCEKLVKLGVLITANYNKRAIDKTLWYAFKDEEKFGVDEETSKIFYEGQKCPSKGKSASPIPDSISSDSSSPPPSSRSLRDLSSSSAPQKPEPDKVKAKVARKMKEMKITLTDKEYEESLTRLRAQPKENIGSVVGWLVADLEARQIWREPDKICTQSREPDYDENGVNRNIKVHIPEGY